jgi:hypothetical protein
MAKAQEAVGRENEYRPQSTSNQLIKGSLSFKIPFNFKDTLNRYTP